MPNQPENANIHGRKWGRGIRPYLLLPKVLCVAAFFGGLVTILVLAFLRPAPQNTADWLAEADLIRRTYTCVVVPALLAAMIFGAFLLLPVWRALIRMRWLQVKLVVVLLCVPTLHLYMRSRSLQFQAAIRDAQFGSAELLHHRLAMGTLAAIAFAVLVIFLGRIKPRLGQDYGRTFARRQ
jgi:uncharacterized membrane protein